VLPEAAIKGHSVQLAVLYDGPTKYVGPSEDGGLCIPGIASTVGILWRMKAESVVTSGDGKQTRFRHVLLTEPDQRHRSLWNVDGRGCLSRSRVVFFSKTSRDRSVCHCIGLEQSNKVLVDCAPRVV
jgi:hypothetical protein